MGEQRPPRPTKPDKAATFQALTPAVGWTAVYWTNDQHVARAFHFFALTEDHEGPPIPVEYTPSRRWVQCDNEANFCGLLPPGRGLEDFEAQVPCPHVVHHA